MGTMKGSIITCFILVSLFNIHSLAVNAAAPKLWLWLSGHTAEAMSEIQMHKGIISSISFGGYSVGANGTFAGKVNATLISQLQGMNIEAWPLIGCGSTKTLRILMSNPDAFINFAVSEIVKQGFDGYNIDFEPYDGLSTNEDGVNYGIFLDKFAAALHKVNKKLSVDYFSNLPIWNLGAMNSSSTDYFISMDTYVQDNSTFEAYFNIASSKMNGERIGVGMCAGTRPAPYTPYGPNPCPVNPWSTNQLEERFAFLHNLIVKTPNYVPFAQINMWVLPLSNDWWDVLTKYFTIWKKLL